jgi:hypothetical protein
MWMMLLGSCGKHEPYKTDGYSTGPLINSGFVCRLGDSIPLLFLTAHHVVAGYSEDEYLQWDELKEKVKGAWIWSMHDSTYEVQLGKNLPIPGAETLSLDLAAFYIATPEKVSALPLSDEPAKVGDTVRLLSRIRVQDTITFLHPARVVYTADSVLVYELLSRKRVRMSGTSGSPVLNPRGEVVANSFGGFTILNEAVKADLIKEFPLLADVPLMTGKSYGIGLPAVIIQQTVMSARVHEADTIQTAAP